jgi:tungstate transport system substrate-binding protein
MFIKLESVFGKINDRTKKIGSNKILRNFKLLLVGFVILSILVSFNVFLLSCSKKIDTEVILATTTSTYDSGLLDELLPAFEEETGFKVKPIAVGTGEAIAMGERGEADVILVHARSSEDEFVEEGYGIGRKDVMHNDFVIIGSESDPAAVKGMSSAGEAFQAVSETENLFVSRGDNSGTNKKELKIWENAGISPQGDWYVESGQGMGATLRIADEKQAYTMTDRGTYLSQEETLSLIILVEGDEILFNPYGVIPVNPDKHKDIDINYEGACAFADFITGEKGQAIIKEFGVEKYGQPLFYPDVIK